ncbi:MAG: glycosyltransferase family 39 protein [archaeon]
MTSQMISLTWQRLSSTVTRIKHNYDVLILVLFALTLYMSFMSCSFDEWDSYNYALALTEYNIVGHKPHPPGYPLYVFLGRAAFSLTGNPLTALTSVSAISGALTIAPVYALSRKMYNRRTAIFTSLVLMFTPALWISSELALTDSLFMLLLMLAISLLYFGVKGSTKMLELSWLVYGFAIGARPTPAALTFMALWIPSTVILSTKKRTATTFVKALLYFTAGVLVWFAPMIYLTGWNEYWRATTKLVVDASTAEFVWARTGGLDSIQRLGHVVMQILAFSLGGAFLGIRDLFGSGNPYVHFQGALLIVAIITSILNITKIADKLFLFLWIAPYFTFVYVFGTLNYPRYYLPMIPAILIPFIPSSSEIIVRILRKGRMPTNKKSLQSCLRYSFSVILVITFFVNSLPLAMIVHTEYPPTKQIFTYVTSNYAPGTIIIESHEHRVFQYYSNDVQYLHVRQNESQVISELSRFSPSHTILITTSAYTFLSSHPAIVELSVSTIIEFFREPHVVIEDHRIILYRVVSVKLR